MEDDKLRHKKIILYATSIFLITLLLFKGFSNFYESKSTLTQNIIENKKIIYLTFDDGPSTTTNKILDILKENNVKATFFLIGKEIKDFEPTVKRIHNEGHSIGLHTYTHKINYIYANEENFIKEMTDCRNEINRVTGISPSIIRFPCGSIKHLNSAYLNKLHSYNFKIYDWNVETSDGINPKLSPERQFKRAVKESKNLSQITLLMHCGYPNKNTYKTLPKIIKYYKEKGYEFKTITDNTPEVIQ